MARAVLAIMELLLALATMEVPRRPNPATARLSLATVLQCGRIWHRLTQMRSHISGPGMAHLQMRATMLSRRSRQTTEGLSRSSETRVMRAEAETARARGFPRRNEVDSHMTMHRAAHMGSSEEADTTMRPVATVSRDTVGATCPCRTSTRRQLMSSWIC